MSSCISHRHQLSFRTHFSHISSHPLLVTADIGTRRPRMAGGMLLWVRYRTLPYFILINNALLHCACRPLLTNDIHKCSTTLVFLLFVDHFLTTKFSNTHQAMLYLVMFVDRHFLPTKPSNLNSIFSIHLWNSGRGYCYSCTGQGQGFQGYDQGNMNQGGWWTYSYTSFLRLLG